MTGQGRIDIGETAALVDERTVAICASAVASKFWITPAGRALGSDCAAGQLPLFRRWRASRRPFRVDAAGGICGHHGRARTEVAPRWSRAGHDGAVGLCVASSRPADHRRPERRHLVRGRRLHAAGGCAALRGRGVLRCRSSRLAGIHPGARSVSALRMFRAEINAKLLRLRANLRNIPGLTVFEDEDAGAAFLTFQHASLPANTIVEELAMRGIAVASVGVDPARWEL